jgi:hypothetical protein
VQNSSHALILLVLLQRSLPGLRLGAALLPFLARTIPAAAGVGLLLLWTWPWLSQLGLLPGLVAAGVLGGVVYLAALLLLGVSEVRATLDLLRRPRPV